jgi:LysR family nod box-dependent transcriptional activator
MRFKGLDLNLLIAFEVLMETRSVSRAAERMNLSQAAMSSALGRLRDYFGDEILVVDRKRMFPTAFAETLMPQVRECLRHLGDLVATTRSFDPSTSKRTFRVVASDYVSAVLLVPLAEHLVKVAPNLCLEILLPSDLVLKQIEDGIVDLLITPQDFVSPELPAVLLYEERHVVVGWKENSLLGGGAISEDELFGCGHVTVSIGNQRTLAFGDRHLEILRKDRRIEITVPSFTMAPWFLINTQRLAVMHERLAVVMEKIFPLAHVPLPFAFPLMKEMAQFRFARANDEGLTWLRQEMKIFADLIVRNHQ